jgi:hypothetical protein
MTKVERIKREEERVSRVLEHKRRLEGYQRRLESLTGLEPMQELMRQSFELTHGLEDGTIPVEIARAERKRIGAEIKKLSPRTIVAAERAKRLRK